MARRLPDMDADRGVCRKRRPRRHVDGGPADLWPDHLGAVADRERLRFPAAFGLYFHPELGQGRRAAGNPVADRHEEFLLAGRRACEVPQGGSGCARVFATSDDACDSGVSGFLGAQAS